MPPTTDVTDTPSMKRRAAKRDAAENVDIEMRLAPFVDRSSVDADVPSSATDTPLVES
jgi:hypothetical protein